MSRIHSGVPKLALRGRKRPDVAVKIAAAWSPEMRAAAKARGIANAADPAWREKIALSVSGDKNPMWAGGMARSKYAPGFSRKLKDEIRNRDDYRCQLCGTTEEELGYRLTIHHIDYDKTNHDPANLASTCKGCNSRVNANREVWEGYFTALCRFRESGSDMSFLFRARRTITQNVGFISSTYDYG